MDEGPAQRCLRKLLRPIWRSRTLGLWAERYFWWRWIRTGGLSWPQEFERRLDPRRPLLPHVAAYVRDVAGEPVRILDVGAGAVTSLGYRLEGRSLHITAVDVLAGSYDRLWGRRRAAPPVRTQYADAERLTQWFEPESFDFVYSQNALDHTSRPSLAIEQMVKVAKPGCYIVLDHALDEAVGEHYTGLHQWNFSERAGDFIVWNQSETINMTRRLSPACAVRTERREDSVFVEILRLAQPDRASATRDAPDRASPIGG
jgi:SAM-dependent methyltransferase